MDKVELKSMRYFRISDKLDEKMVSINKNSIRILLLDEVINSLYHSFNSNVSDPIYNVLRSNFGN